MFHFDFEVVSRFCVSFFSAIIGVDALPYILEVSSPKSTKKKTDFIVSGVTLFQSSNV